MIEKQIEKPIYNLDKREKNHPENFIGAKVGYLSGQEALIAETLKSGKEKDKESLNWVCLFTNLAIKALLLNIKK